MKIQKTFQGSVPENKILNTDSNSQTDTYSCDYIKKILTYQIGDKETISVSRAVGHITGSSKSLNFLIPLSKMILPEVTSVAVTGQIKMRQAGNYLPSNTWLELSEIGSSQCTINPSGICVIVTLNEVQTNTINNDVVALELQNIVITFS